MCSRRDYDVRYHAGSGFLYVKWCVNSIEEILENFVKSGLANVQGENVVLIIKNIMTVCGSLSEVQKYQHRHPPTFYLD